MSERIISVEDHGMWRGHHAWTVHIEDVAVSARGDTKDDAIKDALGTYRNRLVISDDERAAMQRANATLGCRLRGRR